MGKSPAFLFYPNDWDRDLGSHPHEIGGAWMLILCSLFWKGGSDTKTLGEWAKILRESKKKTEKIFNYLNEKRIADFEFLDNQNITIISRRLVRDLKISQLRKEVGKLGGNPKLLKQGNLLDNQNDNQNLTPSFSSSVSYPKKKRDICVAYTDAFLSFWEIYPKKAGKKPAFQEWERARKEKVLPPLDAILSAVENQKRAKEISLQTGQFAPEWPDPERWIKKARWEDEIEEIQEDGIDAWLRQSSQTQ